MALYICILFKFKGGKCQGKFMPHLPMVMEERESLHLAIVTE